MACNPAALKLAAMERDPQGERLDDLLYAPSQPQWSHHVAQALADKGYWEGELAAPPKAGVALLASWVLLRDGDGRPLYRCCLPRTCPKSWKPSAASNSSPTATR